MILPITALFAGLITIWYGYQAIRISFLRGAHKVSLGDGGVSELARQIRVHGNAAEYVPLLLLICALLEFHGTREEILYVYIAVALIGRQLHARGILRSNLKARIWGMQLTLWPLALGSLLLVYTWFVQTFIF